MAKLKIVDDILAPHDTVKIKFEGKEPFLAMAQTPYQLRRVMKIPGKDLLETDVRWDISGDPRDFYGMWMGKRSEDRWTTTKIRIIIQGKQNSKDKTGQVEIEFKGTMETEYEYSNFIQRTFWFFYNRTFYHKQRQAYLELAKDNIFDLRDIFMDMFNIGQE